MDRTAVAAFAAQSAQVTKDLWGETLTIAGTAYTAAVGLPPYEGRLGDGGEMFSGDLLVAILKTDLTDAPPLQTEVTARGKEWTVTRVTGDGPMAAWHLRCTPRN
jgi:hypothetical protein